MQLVDRFPGKIIRPALKFLITLLAIIFLIFIGNVYSQTLSIVITEPKDGKEVCWRSMVKGTVSDPNLQVFVAIHPMATDKFWINQIKADDQMVNW